MLGASVGYAAMGALVKLAGESTSVATVVAARSIVVVAVAVVMARAQGLSWRPGAPWTLLARCLIGFTALTCYYIAITRIQLASAVTLQFTSPLFVALFSVWMLGERATLGMIACIVTALVGAVMVVVPDPMQLLASAEPDALYAVASAVLAGVAYVLVRKLKDTDAPEIIVLHFAIFSALVSIPGALWLDDTWPDLRTWLVLVGVGVAAFVGQILMTYAYRYAEAPFVSAFSYATVVLSALLGFVLFGEVPGTAAVVGSALIIGAGVALSLLRWRREALAMPAPDT